MTTTFDAKLDLWSGALIERVERSTQSLAASVEQLSSQQLPRRVHSPGGVAHHGIFSVAP